MVTVPHNSMIKLCLLSTLTTKQNLAYTIILNHYHPLTQNRHPSPLHMIICGTAGTGKVYLISAIAQALGEACILTMEWPATTHVEKHYTLSYNYM